MSIPKRGKRTLPCPVDCCTSGRSPSHVMCAPHWYQVPKPLRDSIWRLYENEPGSPAHRGAIAEAIRAVNERNQRAPAPAA